MATRTASHDFKLLLEKEPMYADGGIDKENPLAMLEQLPQFTIGTLLNDGR
jgi:hypothetical protein